MLKRTSETQRLNYALEMYKELCQNGDTILADYWITDKKITVFYWKKKDEKFVPMTEILENLESIKWTYKAI